MASLAAVPGLAVASALGAAALVVPGPASPLAVALVGGVLLVNVRPPSPRLAAGPIVRVSLLAVLVAALAMSRAGAAPQGPLRGLPPFVLAFGVAFGLAAGGLVPDAVLEVSDPARTALLAVGMGGLGSGVRVAGLRRLGLRPLVLGSVSWGLLTGGTVLGVKAVVA